MLTGRARRTPLPDSSWICMGPLKINLSQAFAGQRVGVKQVEEKIWLVSFMRYDLGFFDHETCRIESAANPFAAKLKLAAGSLRIRILRLLQIVPLQH
jgi:hypothetical protein